MPDVPTPPGLPIIGHLMAMRFDALAFVRSLMERYDGLTAIKVGPRRIYIVTDPEIAHALLHKNHRALTKDTHGMRQLSLIVGSGLLTSDGDLWRRQRRIAQPAFHKQRIAAFGKTMVEVAREVEARWLTAASAGTTVDLGAEMMATTLSIVSRTLLGSDLSRDAAEVAHALDYLLVETRKRTANPWALPLSVPTLGNRRFSRAVQSIDALLVPLIEQRSQGATGDDLLQMLVDAVDDETGERMNPKQLRDEVVTMFIAGHETTGSALTWVFYLLARHPDARTRLWAELDAVLAGRAPTLDDLPQLPWLSQVLDEAMRLYPPAWLFARQTTEDLDIAGYTIPRNVTVLVSPYAIHRNPRYWPNADAFDPERFAPENTTGHHAQQFLPFGSANRMCIGRGFALIEAKLVLATLMQRFTWNLKSDRPATPQAAVTLRPRDPLLATLSVRN